jgi:hypothetical protein
MFISTPRSCFKCSSGSADSGELNDNAMSFAWRWPLAAFQGQAIHLSRYMRGLQADQLGNLIRINVQVVDAETKV